MVSKLLVAAPALSGISGTVLLETITQPSTLNLILQAVIVVGTFLTSWLSHKKIQSIVNDKKDVTNDSLTNKTKTP